MEEQVEGPHQSESPPELGVFLCPFDIHVDERISRNNDGPKRSSSVELSTLHTRIFAVRLR